MGIKTRSNYRINLCLKQNCINRGKKCKDCIRFSMYRKIKE